MHSVKVDLTLLPAGRQLAFSKTLLEVAHVFRRVGGESGRWLVVAVNYHSPYLDTDVFAPGTLLEYYVQHESQQGVEEARSHVVSTTIKAVPPQNTAADPPVGMLLPGNQHEQRRSTPLLTTVSEGPTG